MTIAQFRKEICMTRIFLTALFFGVMIGDIKIHEDYGRYLESKKDINFEMDGKIDEKIKASEQKIGGSYITKIEILDNKYEYLKNSIMPSAFKGTFKPRKHKTW